MSDHLRPDPDPNVTRGLVARLRQHLVDVTPLRRSADFRRLFVGRSISELGDEIVAVAVPFLVYDITVRWFAPSFWRYDAAKPTS